MHRREKGESKNSPSDRSGRAVMATQTSILLWVSHPKQWVAVMMIVLFPCSYTRFIGIHVNSPLLVPIHEALSADGNMPIRHKHCMYIIGQYLLSI